MREYKREREREKEREDSAAALHLGWADEWQVVPRGYTHRRVSAVGSLLSAIYAHGCLSRRRVCMGLQERERER